MVGWAGVVSFGWAGLVSFGVPVWSEVVLGIISLVPGLTISLKGSRGSPQLLFSISISR